MARATPQDSGFTGAILAKGTFDEFNVRANDVPPGLGGNPNDKWFAMQMTKGSSDLFVVSNVWLPGASTGWHRHPGYSLIIVTEGEITAYDGDDPSCTPHVFKAGAGGTLIDANHVHMVRNNGSITARAYVVQIVPEGAGRRIDASGPGIPNCPP
jgi:quercetin dioxygenase-like cupin family protein